jgi:hypothetical protein
MFENRSIKHPLNLKNSTDVSFIDYAIRMARRRIAKNNGHFEIAKNTPKLKFRTHSLLAINISVYGQVGSLCNVSVCFV